MNNTIFILEDDPIIKEALTFFLESQNFTVKSYSSIKAAEDAIQQSSDYSLFLLDINLPDGDGVQFCHYLRTKNHSSPVLFLTARADEDSLVKGFSNGGDDYIRKPFNNAELLTRIKYQLSLSLKEEKVIRYNDAVLSLSKQQLQDNGCTLELSQKEFLILKTFFESPGMIITRDKLLDIMSPGDEILDRTIDTHISHLRRKLRKENFNRFLLTSVYGAGYKIEAINND